MPERPQSLDVWVLAGQSNMQGVGELRGALPPDARVWSFNSAGEWEVASEPLHRLWESFTPVHQALMRPGLPEEWQNKTDAELAELEATTRNWGSGLGLAFGVAMADALERPIGLIPAAHGGTTLEQWSPEKKDEGGHSLYGAMLERITRAGGTLRGVLWYQGESDAFNTADADSYRQRFIDWVERLREDLGDPRLPVLVVQLGRLTSPGSFSACAWNTVREAQYQLPDDVNHTAVTSAVDLGLIDTIHVNAYGLIRLGRRMARQALALTVRPYGEVGPRVVATEIFASGVVQGRLRIRCSGVTGRWRPADHLGGFTIAGADGQPIPDNAVVNAFPDPEDPAAIIINTNLPLQPNDWICYGQGFDPYCNVVDEADMPLCSFRRRVTG